MFNIQTGEDDDHPLGGDIGEQSAAPFNPMPSAAPGPEVIPPTPAPMPPPPVAPPPAAPGVPPIPQYTPQALPPIPPSRTVTPAESQNLHALDANAAARETTAGQQGGINAVGAVAKDQAAERGEFIADAFRKEQQRIATEAQKRIQEREAQATKDYDAFKAFGIKDPQASDNFATRILKAITIGLGQYSAGMNGGPNTALNIIQDAAKENIARQKAQQEKLFQVAQKSGKDIEQARQERDDAFGQLNLKHAALLDSSSAMLRSELARLGMPQAQIDANKDVQALEKESLGLRENELRSIRESETRLAQADISAAGRKAKAAASGGGGGRAMEGNAQLAEYAQQNPGDTAGLYRLGAKLGLKKKDVDSTINQNKVTGEGGKEAGQGAVALRAVDAIEKSGYTPGRDEIQKWMANQRDVARAASMSEGKGIGGALGGGLANLAQSKGVLAQNEFDGLSPKAKEYFTNVRRYMETIGRVQSGAAISNSEWNNFYGQYGPQSEGGLEAARQFARDRFRMSGVAGRVLERGSGGEVPGASGPAPAAPRGASKANDPRAKLARDAIADPKASQAEKARALQILRSLGQVDTL